MNSTVGLTVVHDPRVYRLKAGTTVSAMRTWDSHHFDQLGSNALCGAMLDARSKPWPSPITAIIIIVDDVYYHLRLLHICTCGAIGRPLGGACVHYCCCGSVAQNDVGRSATQNEHPWAMPAYDFNTIHPALRID
jgi:hypothetical protein